MNRTQYMAQLSHDALLKIASEQRQLQMRYSALAEEASDLSEAAAREIDRRSESAIRQYVTDSGASE